MTIIRKNKFYLKKKYVFMYFNTEIFHAFETFH